MDTVKTFNNELYSLNDYKPPISKAKMTQITKAAIKALKFYKHVVQSVEKFIQKCKPEYKVPGLYVVDSIVRQSRHQFGQEKDVFAPRFSNNIINTFQNLYRCPTDDKSKIVRVLNLWQKNKVFKSEIIQPLLDMASGIPPPVVTPVLPNTAASLIINTPGTPATPVTPANTVQGIPDPWIAQITNTDTLAAVAQILQSPQGQQLQQLVQTWHVQQQKPQPSLLQAIDAGLVVQLQALTAQLTSAAAASKSLNPLEKSVSLSKNLVENFDLEEEKVQNEELNVKSPSVLVASAAANNSIFHQLAEHLQKQNIQHIGHQFLEQSHTPMVTDQENQEVKTESENSSTPPEDDILMPSRKEELQHNLTDLQQEDMDIEEVQDVIDEDALFETEEEKMTKAEIPKALSKSRSPRKRRSRSRSGPRRHKYRKYSRSRSRERRRKTSRSYSSERRARERDRERQKKGLPPIRSKTLSVCSTTLWIGQVDKKATQQDLTNVFEEFGQIESINMIPPRGCAYVCMVHRQDASRALQKLSGGSCKIGSKVIKIAWALNKGMKPEYKQFWDVDLGVTYVPWEKVNLDDLDDFAEGGMIDQESINIEWSKQRHAEVTAAKEPHTAAHIPTTTVQSSDIKKSTILTQTDAYSQPVAMLQIPVTPRIPSMSLVPPAFPMSLPPPGFSALPPPPFMRSRFNPSQPPPGFIPPHGPPSNTPPVSTAIPTAPQSTVVNSAGILSVQPQPTIPSPLGMPGRITCMPFLDMHPGFISERTATRFALLTAAMQSSQTQRNMLPPTFNDSGLHTFPFPPGDVLNNLTIPNRLPSDNNSSQDRINPLPSCNIQREGDQDYRFPPVENSILSGGEQKEQSLPVAHKEHNCVAPVDESEIKIMHLKEDCQPPNMAVVDFEGKVKLPEAERKVVSQSQGQDQGAYENKMSHESLDSKAQSIELRQHFGNSILDALQPIGRHSLEIREMFRRLPPELCDNFNRLIPDGHLSGVHTESKKLYVQPILGMRNVSQSSVDGKEHLSTPILDTMGHFGTFITDGKQGQLQSDKIWAHKGDFDERHLSLTGFSGSKVFPGEIHGEYRPDPGSVLGWNKWFELGAGRDFDERRCLWEGHRDKDDRDFAFQKEVNGNNSRTERQSNSWIPPQLQMLDSSVSSLTNQKESSITQVNGDVSDQLQSITCANNPTFSKSESSDQVYKEDNQKNDKVLRQSVVESLENERT